MIKFNSVVDLHYSISNLEGVEFESTFDSKPIKVKIGDGKIPQKLEITLYGLKQNSEQTMTLDPADAFGIRDTNKVKAVKKSAFPNQEMIKKGNVIEIDVKENGGETNVAFAMIKQINADDVILDLNHPLAGQKIMFKVKIIKIYE